MSSLQAPSRPRRIFPERSAGEQLRGPQQVFLEEQMSSPVMSPAWCYARCRQMAARVALAFAALLLLTLAAPSETFAQSFNRTYPARQNVRLQLRNRSGSITVEGWDRGEIKVTARMETSAARFTPELTDDSLTIDLMREGRADAGDVNFHIYVPVSTSVDLETRLGNITVRRVQGAMVRARVVSSGDIELTEIRSANVVARNTMGNILFDGEFQNGSYSFTSMQGDIHIRIPANSNFELTATAFRARTIDLGGFAAMGVFNFMSGRRVTGKVGNGEASVIIENHGGPITFTRR